MSCNCTNSCSCSSEYTFTSKVKYDGIAYPCINGNIKPPYTTLNDFLKYMADKVCQLNNLENVTNFFQNVVIVNSVEDFPDAVANVITLDADITYIVATDVDLNGSRLVTNGINNLFGFSSEISYLTSTGLGAGIPLLTSDYTIVIENITFRDVDTAISIDGNSRTVALDWENVNFLNVPNIGTINTCDNFIMSESAFLNSKGMKFTGTIGTIAISNSLLRGDGAAGNVIELDASCIITRRFRIIYSSIIASGSTVGINVNVAATIPTESYILDTISFSGGGTYLSGVTDTSNKSLFKDCTNIINTSVNGQMYMQNNATATTIADTVTFVKIAGTTTASVDNNKYSHSNNRLTCDAVIDRKYLIQCSLSFTSGNNNVCEFGFYDSKLGAVRTPSRTQSTANASGRAESVTFFCVVDHNNADYIEIWGRNTSAITNITVSDMNVVITNIK